MTLFHKLPANSGQEPRKHRHLGGLGSNALKRKDVQPRPWPIAINKFPAYKYQLIISEKAFPKLLAPDCSLDLYLIEK